MAKAVLVMDMPESCSMCKFLYEFQGVKKCQLMNVLYGGASKLSQNAFTEKRHEKCPLRELPERKPASERWECEGSAGGTCVIRLPTDDDAKKWDQYRTLGIMPEESQVNINMRKQPGMDSDTVENTTSVTDQSSDSASRKDHDDMIDAITEALNFLQKYKEIGTPEEFREALRKSQISAEVSADNNTVETEERITTQTEEGWSINTIGCVQSVLKTFPHSTIRCPFLLLEPIGDVKMDISDIDSVVDFKVALLKTISIAVVTHRPFVSPLKNCKWQTGLQDYLNQYLKSSFTLYDLNDVYYVSDNTEVLREFVESEFDSRVISYMAEERRLNDKNR